MPANRVRLSRPGCKLAPGIPASDALRIFDRDRRDKPAVPTWNDCAHISFQQIQSLQFSLLQFSRFNSGNLLANAKPSAKPENRTCETSQKVVVRRNTYLGEELHGHVCASRRGVVVA
jgi:hypothetical protein